MSRSPAASRPPRRGAFTVIEVLLVLVVVVILVALVTPRMLRTQSQERVTTTSVELDTLAEALEAYRRDMGQYPTSAQGLAALTQQASTGRRSYMGRGYTIDAWGHRFLYRSMGDSAAPSSYEILSQGADGRTGGDGVDTDIVRRK